VATFCAALWLTFTLPLTEARGRKLLRNPDNSREHSRAPRHLQLSETAQQLAIQRNRSWFVRNDS
jgi:hypothetical protein